MSHKGAKIISKNGRRQGKNKIRLTTNLSGN